MVHPENPSFNPGWESDEAGRVWKEGLPATLQDRVASGTLTLGRLRGWGMWRAHPHP